MAEKLINTRIALRIDTLANWSKTDVEGKGAKLVLKRGEIGLCEIPSGNAAAQTAPTVLFKVGDGTTPFGELKWASALAADVYSWAKADDVVLEEEVIKFKKGTEVVKSIDLSKFALNSELTTAVGLLEAADAALGKRIDDVIAAAYDDTEVRGLITKEVSDREAADLVLEGKITTAQNAANKAQEEIDALEGVVSALNGTVSSEIARVAGLIEDEADAREAADQAIENKIGTVAEGKTVVGLISDVEGKVTSLENGQVKTNKEAIETIKSTYVKTSVYDADKVVLEEAIAANTKKIGDDIATAKTELQGYADGKASTVQGNLDTHIGAYNTKVQALEGADSTLDGKISQEIKDRGAAVSAVENAIAAEKSRAEGIEAGLRTDISNIQSNISSGLHFRGIKNALTEVENPVSGDIVIVGTQEYIYDGEAWEEFGNAEAHATVEYVNNELGKKVDNTTYSSKIAELVEEDADIRADFAAADASLKSELEGKINGKVAQDDFNTLKGRVDGHDTTLGTKLDKSEFTTHVNAYNAHITAQASVDSNQNDRIKAVEDSLKDGGSINDLIKAAQAQANKGVADAKAAQDDVDALVGKVGTISGEKTLVEQLAAVKATADNAAKASDVDSTISAINDVIATKAAQADLTALTTRVTTAEGKITAAEGNITTLQGKVTALEGRYTDSKVEERITAVVNTEKARAEAAEAALSGRIKVYEDKFGGTSDLLVFNCGDSTTNI